ncbi:MAG: histidine phosphatase family protein [Actinomycetota bacterium]|nr:histidine phosphatase family protein [Actinomycetota bacterium]
MKTAIFARHGESEFSVREAVNGDPGVECLLTATGREQGRGLGEALRDEQLDLCVVTEFQRTWETADLALEGREVPRLVRPDLNDIRFGDEFEGRPLADYRAWGSEHPPTTDAPGGGESRTTTVLRYVEAYRALAERSEATILVIAHGLPIRYALNALEGGLPAPIVDQVPYAEPYRFDEGQLKQAAELLERWAANPVWPRTAAGG